jgi:hypothetical protein
MRVMPAAEFRRLSIRWPSSSASPPEEHDRRIPSLLATAVAAEAGEASPGRDAFPHSLRVPSATCPRVTAAIRRWPVRGAPDTPRTCVAPRTLGCEDSVQRYMRSHAHGRSRSLGELQGGQLEIDENPSMGRGRTRPRQGRRFPHDAIAVDRSLRFRSPATNLLPPVVTAIGPAASYPAAWRSRTPEGGYARSRHRSVHRAREREGVRLATLGWMMKVTSYGNA